MKKHIGIALLAISLAAPATAAAHVTLQPDSVPAGSFARLDVRVPNERDDAATEKVEVQLPDGFIFVSYEPVPGWKADVRSEKLDTPVESHGEQITEQVDTVTWTATDPSAAIQPGQFRDFGLSVGIPEDGAEGDVLTFPAIQTYDSGEVVRWIGDPEAEAPAAQVTLSPTEEEHGASSEEGPEESESGDDRSDDDGSDGLAIGALIAGLAGLGVGGTALFRSRRSS
jgi:periplasmic copper chaperone A